MSFHFYELKRFDLKRGTETWAHRVLLNIFLILFEFKLQQAYISCFELSEILVAIYLLKFYRNIYKKRLVI